MVYSREDIEQERFERKKVMDDATVEIYNLKDEVTKLRIDINALKNRVRELGG